MHSDILNDYLNKDVEVRIKSGDTFEGNLRLFDEQKQVVILSPREGNRKYRRSKEYGDTVLRQPDIIVVREILPHIEEDKEDWDGDEMMKKSVKYSLFDDSDSAEEAQDAYFQQPDFADKQMAAMPAPTDADKIQILQRLEEKLKALTKKSST